MATIICKRNKFNVVYSYYDEAGKRHQKWEAFSTMPEAKQRKSEIEYKQQLGSFTIPTCNTLNELLKEYVSLYGKTKWAINGYSSNTGLIRHYIAPKLGELRLKEITPRVLEMFYQGLLKTPAVPLMTDKKYRQTGKFVQPPTIRKIHNLLHSAFRQAQNGSSSKRTLPSLQPSRNTKCRSATFGIRRRCSTRLTAVKMSD